MENSKFAQLYEKFRSYDRRGMVLTLRKPVIVSFLLKECMETECIKTMGHCVEVKFSENIDLELIRPEGLYGVSPMRINESAAHIIFDEGMLMQLFAYFDCVLDGTITAGDPIHAIRAITDCENLKKLAPMYVTIGDDEDDNK